MVLKFLHNEFTVESTENAEQKIQILYSLCAFRGEFFIM